MPDIWKGILENDAFVDREAILNKLQQQSLESAWRRRTDQVTLAGYYH
jgi:hypothetical protein